MFRQSEIPDACYDLLEDVRRGDKRVPWRDLSERFKDVGLVKVCRSHRLIELVLWYEPSRQAFASLPANCAGVGAPACWLPFHQMSRTSVEDAIARDAECEDPAKFLHVQVMAHGEIVYEEWRLNGKPRSTADAAGSHDDRSADSRLRRLKPSHRNAYVQRCEAQKGNTSIESGQAGDRAAYAWLVDHRDDEQELCSLDTWLRYVREIRRILGEDNPRSGRPHGRSIVSSDDI